jgi:flagellar hook-associated protein 1 FlgK
MPGLFDGYRLAISGINAHRVRMEVVGQNLANAANENYSRQDARLQSAPSVSDGHNFLGQGVEVAEIIRIRDEMLDNQLRQASSSSSNKELQESWLRKIQTAYNEPSDSGINRALSDWWQAWGDLTDTPESFAARADLMSRSSHLSSLINQVDDSMSRFIRETTQEITSIVERVNSLAQEIANLNTNIFEIEAGASSKANDLHDQRDAALDELSSLVDLSTSYAPNGKLNVFIADHPAVLESQAEKLIVRNDPTNKAQLQLVWEFGEIAQPPNNGQLSGIFHIRNQTLPGYREELDALSQLLITETNKVYATGVGLNGETRVESNLGYEALGVSSEIESLNLFSPGESGAITIAFYDSNEQVVRTHSVLVDSDDALADVQMKLDTIPGLDASLLSGDVNDGRLVLALDPSATEASFSVSNHVGGYDTSGFLAAMGFDPTAKSGNDTATAPTLTSLDLDTVANNLGINPANSQTTALNLAGSFTLNAFEQQTPGGSSTQNGYQVQQLTVEVVSSDTITTILAKINALTANYGFSASVNGSNAIEITSSLMTNSEGNVSATGINRVQLSFANVYEGPTVTGDEPPTHYTGTGDDTGLLAQLQFNAFFQGSGASTIALDANITSADAIHAGHMLSSGDSAMALAMMELQYQKVASNQEFTLNESYQNIVSGVGTDVNQMEQLALNDRTLLEGFQAERQRISGVNLDEELANMILFQRVYDANARLFSTFDQMAQEILRII